MSATGDPDVRRSGPLLTIDTASAQGGVGLYDGRTLSTRSWPADRSHTTTLLAEIHHLLDAAELGVAELAAVAVAIGPGAFTGLRVGLGVAKGFHLATGVPLIGVSTLEATALPFATCELPIIAAVAAGRSRLVWARYAPVRGRFSEVTPPRNGRAEELAAEAQDSGPLLVTGELDDEQVATIGKVPTVTMPPPPLRLRQPAAFAEVAWRRLLGGSFDDAASLEPVYLSR